MSGVIVFSRRHRAHDGATPLDIWRSRARLFLGRVMTQCGIPGLINDATIKDSLTGDEIIVSVGPLFVRLSINGRDYYFDRLTGRFDGTGLGCG